MAIAERPEAAVWTEEPVLGLVTALKRAPSELQEILCASSTFQFGLQAVTHGQGDFRNFGESRVVEGGFNIDGEFGFLLQTLDEVYGPVNIAVVSFNLNRRIYDGASDTPGTYPRIVQLQGFTSPVDFSGRNKRVSRTLATLPLGVSGVGLTEHFARSMGYEMVGILPAEANPSKNHEGFNMERAKIRYDGTAEYLNYQREDDGIYLKTL